MAQPLNGTKTHTLAKAMSGDPEGGGASEEKAAADAQPFLQPLCGSTMCFPRLIVKLRGPH